MDWLDAAGDRALRATLSFVRTQARPVTADELARSQGTHRNVARSRLERLAAAGLLTRGYERRTGRTGPGAGRPAKIYAVAPQVRSHEFPERRYEKLIALLLDSLPPNARGEHLRSIGGAFADELFGTVRLRPEKTLAAAAERVCEAIRQIGFHALVSEARDGVAVIETAACPLRPLVGERLDAVEIDRGMWTAFAAGALEGVGPSRIGCETDSCRGGGSCRVTLTVRPRDASE